MFSATLKTIITRHCINIYVVLWRRQHLAVASIKPRLFWRTLSKVSVTEKQQKKADRKLMKDEQQKIVYREREHAALQHFLEIT